MTAQPASTTDGLAVPRWVGVTGFAAATWCLGFAAVSAWQIIHGPDPADRFAAYASGLAVASIVVLVLKLVGAGIAVAAVQPRQSHERIIALALWGAFGSLALYSAGNLVITVGTLTGLMAPSAAWQAAGGVSVKAVLYVLFFLAGAGMFGMLATWYQRRHRTRWTWAAVGVMGAPVLIALLLVILPGILGHLGLLPS